MASFPPHRTDIRLELHNCFKEIENDGPFFDALVDIGVFLTTLPRVESALRDLEENLFKSAFGKHIGATRDKSYQDRAKNYFEQATQRHLDKSQGKTVDKDSDLQHLVTKEFAKEEQRAGFATWKSSGEPQKVLVMGPFSSEGFRRNLEKGRHWKDIVGPNHGEYTHRLQWYLIGKAGIVAEPAKIFRKIGKAATHSYQPYEDGPQVASTAWDAVVDRFPVEDNRAKTFPFISNNACDFRCPEYFLSWLCTQQDRYPILASFLKGRKEKRLAQNLDFTGYIALKVYGMPMAQLTPKQIEQIDEFVRSGTAATSAKDIRKEFGLLLPGKKGYTNPVLPKA